MRSAGDVWEKVKSLMEAGMTAVSIETWFGDVEAVALEDTRLVLCVPTDFKRNIIRTRFLYPRVRLYKTENFYALLSARKEAQPIAKQQKGRKARRQKA